MKLIHTHTLETVKIGDLVTDFKGNGGKVKHFVPPHKPSSSGHISVELLEKNNILTMDAYNYVGVWGLEWIDREDRRPAGTLAFRTPAEWLKPK